MTAEKHDQREEPVLLLTPDEAPGKIVLPDTRKEIAERERLLNEKIFHNEDLQALEPDNNGGASRRDKGYLILSIGLVYLICLPFDVVPSFDIALILAVFLAVFIFLVAFLIEEFTSFKFPKMPIPLIDDAINGLIDLILRDRTAATIAVAIFILLLFWYVAA